VHQAERSEAQFDRTVTDRIRDTYIWAVYPQQMDPSQGFTMVATKVPEQAGRSLAERVSARLEREEALIAQLAPAILGNILHTTLAGMWQSEGVIALGRLWAVFTNYVYMPRLANRDVLDNCVRSAATAILEHDEAFAIAFSRDEENGRFRGLVIPPNSSATLQVTDNTWLVSIERANEQLREEEEEREAAAAAVGAGDFAQRNGGTGENVSGKTAPGDSTDTDDASPSPGVIPQPKHYFGNVRIESDRYGTELSRIVREVVDRLQGAGAHISIDLSITADKPEGFTDSEIRIVSENAQQLGFYNEFDSEGN
jgi:hypothetical protein